MKNFFNRCLSNLRRTATPLLAGLLLASCSQPAAPPPAPAPATGGGKKIIFKGSNTIGEELAPKLAAEFKKEHADVAFDLEPKQTGYGIAALMHDECDIAGASRAILPEETEMARDRKVELNDYVIASYSVAVVVNAANPVANLTREQVRDVFTGAIKNWKDVGGSESPIHLYIRDPISGTYTGFRELAMEGRAYAPEPKLLTNYTQIEEAVAKDPGGIGYSGIDATVKPGAKAVSIAGVAPSMANVNKGQYSYVRVLRFYTNKAKESADTKAFVDFVLSPKGQDVVTKLGLVPHP